MLKQKRKDNKLSQAKLSDILGYAQSESVSSGRCSDIFQFAFEYLNRRGVSEY